MQEAQKEEKKLISISGHDQYTRGSLEREQLNDDPFKTFKQWMESALNSKVKDPEALCLSTCNKQGIVSSRMVLLRRLDERGFVFFTNYESRKGKEMTENPNASMCFHWKEMERQIRIVGKVERVTSEESDEYFQTRPLLSRVGAWASPQSQVIQDRSELDNHVNEIKEKFGANEGDEDKHQVPLPPFWGGIRLIPSEIEFWQGRDNRLHDRFVFKRQDEKSEWKVDRLAP
eukprot:TRINITY_DN4976_c0_g1_i1.p2 TRINITY_DN4976_c0_g1~~TRINITY_DN4976_c0_g1_i1.p2  ORF type:complete len:231 (-),score=99.12 TRINITY_DN4976_c0_g1_i1:173-865(-)